MTDELRLVTTGVDETRKLGEVLARVAREGDLIVLAGDLGAGKTAFAQGFALGLGVAERVTSPTFTLVHEHLGRLRLVHVDVYRLDRLNEVLELGVSDALEEGAVALVEWGDAVAPALPADYLELAITFGSGDDDRLIDIHVVGPSWLPRIGTVRRSVSPWVVHAEGGSC